MDEAIIACRAVLFVSVMLAFGASAFRLYAGAGSDPGLIAALDAQSRDLLLVSAVVGLLSALMLVPLVGGQMAGSMTATFEWTTISTVLLKTSFGRVWRWHLLTSLRRVLRLMRQNNLLAPTRTGSPRGPRNHDGTIIPERVDAMWGTDLTTTITGEGQAAAFVALDHCSAACVGIHAHARATRFQALEPIRQGVRHHFGGFAKAIARGLAVRHDHGSQYMSDHFQKELVFLGIESSPAFVRAPEGNGCAERFIRTLKENLLWVRTFQTIEELRQALLAFRETYNTTWLVERHGFLTPTQFRQRQLQTAAIAA